MKIIYTSIIYFRKSWHRNSRMELRAYSTVSINEKPKQLRDRTFDRIMKPQNSFQTVASRRRHSQSEYIVSFSFAKTTNRANGQVVKNFQIYKKLTYKSSEDLNELVVAV